MVGRFNLPSLPSLPSGMSGMLDFLDTSPQVFYPPSRPSSRSSASCPSSPIRRAQPDSRLPTLPPLPVTAFPTHHPPTSAPLEASALAHRTSSLNAPVDFAPVVEVSRATPGSTPVSTLPPRASAHDGTGAWRPIRTRSFDMHTAPTRPAHRRSHSSVATRPSTAPPLPMGPPPLAFEHLRSSASTVSLSCLETLEENDGSPRGERTEYRPHHRSQTSHSSTRSSGSQQFPPAAGDRRSWIEPAPPAPPTVTGRRRAQSSVTVASVSSVASSSSGYTSTSVLPTRLHRSSISFSGNRISRLGGGPGGRSRGNSVSSLKGLLPDRSNTGSPAPAPVPASVSVSDIAALATWSQEPVATLASPRTRSHSMMAAPSDHLRARLRTLSELDPLAAARASSPSLQPTATFATPLSPLPQTPHSTHATPGHGTPKRTPRGTPHTPQTPGSSTPTTSSHHAAPPLSPTPTRRVRLRSSAGSGSGPDALLLIQDQRPTTSRLRQPTQLSMVTVGTDFGPHPPRSRRGSTLSMLEPATTRSRRGSVQESTAPHLLARSHSLSHSTRGRRASIRLDCPTPTSPPLASSPGSLVSDHGTVSPTTSVESLSSLGRSNSAASSTRSHSTHSSGDKYQHLVHASVTSTRTHSTHSSGDKYQHLMHAPVDTAPKRPSRSYTYTYAQALADTPTHARPHRNHTLPPAPVFTFAADDSEEGERFLDFDDI